MSEPLTLSDLRSTGDSLTDTLNTLLANIHLPFVLESPLDLTPSLLLAILECIQQERLPISITIRESRSEWAKIEAMKIFLGVLESDIIKSDVGLSDVDPRKLAAGEWDELVFVGDLLCWLGKTSGILLDNDNPVEEEPEDVFGKARDNTVSLGLSQSRSNIVSPSTHSSLTDSANTGLSMVSATNNGSDTTVMSPSLDARRSISPFSTPHPPHRTDISLIQEEHRPLCIHELEDDSFVLRALRESNLDDSIELEDSSADLSYCDCPSGVSGSSTVPIQHTGWLQKVDDEFEIQSFEVNRRRRALNNNHNKNQDFSVLGRSEGRNFSAPSSSNALSRSEGYDLPRGVVTRHNSPTQHTLALMNERAKLLTELASLTRVSPRTR